MCFSLPEKYKEPPSLHPELINVNESELLKFLFSLFVWLKTLENIEIIMKKCEIIKQDTIIPNLNLGISDAAEKNKKINKQPDDKTLGSIIGCFRSEIGMYRVHAITNIDIALVGKVIIQSEFFIEDTQIKINGKARIIIKIANSGEENKSTKISLIEEIEDFIIGMESFDAETIPEWSAVYFPVGRNRKINLV